VVDNAKVVRNNEIGIKKSLPYLISLQSQWSSPGIVVCVMRKGKVVWNEAFGYADIENAIPLTTQSKIRIASISKSFTSAAIGLLYEEGKLDLDAPITKYLKEFPEPKEGAITTRLLGSHLSGIRHYKKEAKEFYSTLAYASVTHALEAFKNDPLLHPPGTKFHYTTFGYTLLSAVLEKASGKNYLSFMKERVFDPLGMTNTCPDEQDRIIPFRAHHYRYKKHGMRNTPYVDLSIKWAGGGFLSTAEDVCRFGASFLSGSLLKPETIKLLFTPQKTLDGHSVDHGIGWVVKKATRLTNKQVAPDNEKGDAYSEGWVVYHTGGAVGASSILMMLPEKEVVVSMILNVHKVNSGLKETALQICNNFAED